MKWKWLKQEEQLKKVREKGKNRIMKAIRKLIKWKKRKADDIKKRQKLRNTYNIQKGMLYYWNCYPDKYYINGKK